MAFSAVKNKKENGQTVVEVLVAVAIFSALATSAIFLILGSFESVRYGGDAEVASAFAQEGIDAARSVANQGWGELPVGGPYGVSAAAGYWQLSGGGDATGKFSRAISVEQVYRDGSGNIAPSGTLDPRTKKINTLVNWETVAGRPNSINLISYFTLWAGRAWTETTTADFSDGTFTDTEPAAVGDGAVALASIPGSGYSLAGSYNSSGSQDGTDVFVVGNTAYFITANNSSGPEFFIVNVTNPASPTLISSLDLGAAANGIYVSGNYAYVASANNSQELQIINVSNPAAPTLVGSYDASGSTDATDVWVSGNYAYLVRLSSGQPELYKINVTNKSSPSLTGSTEIGGNVNGIHVSGNYAYLATSVNSQEMVAVNLTPTNPTVVGSYNAPGNQDGIDIFVDGTTAYLITQPSSSDKLFIIDVTNPASPSLISSASWGGSSGTTYSVFKNGNFVFVGVNQSADAVQIFDVSNPASPVLSSTITTVGGNALGLYFSGSYLYVANSDDNGELKIYSAPAESYQTSGTYVSSIFDAASPAAWNFISWDQSLCVGCTMEVQMRTATSAAGIPAAEWAGPNGKDGNPADWFTNYAGEAIHADHTGDEFIQYRVFFTGPGSDTGILRSISVEYQI